MALPTYDRSSGKLLSGTNSSSLNNTVPNPKGGLPIFVRENNVNTSIKEIPSSIESPIKPKKDKTTSSILSNIPIIKGLTENKNLGPKVTSTIDTVSNKLGLNDNLNTIDSIINNPISQTNRSVKNTLGLSILDSLRGMTSQLTGVVGKSFANNAEMKKGWEEIYRNQGISDKNNPYTKDKEPMLDKLVGFDIHGTIAGKAQQLKSKLDTDASQYIETELSKDPFNKTFAGKTTRAVGGMIPQVALSFMRTPTAILSLSEAGMNAEQSYKENIDKGISPDDAKSTAVKQLGADLLGTYFTNKLGSLGSIEKAIAGKVKGGIAKGILNYFKDAGLEVVQETYQQFLQNIATDKPWGEGLSETAKLTIIPAMLFGAAGPIANIKNTEEMSDVQKAVAANEVANKIRDKQMEEGQGNPDIVADSELNEIADIASMNAQAKITEAGTDYDTVLKEIGISKELQSNIIQPINTDNNIIPKDGQVNVVNNNVPSQVNENPVIEPLIQEAKKYKSAEDFVKAQPKLYHGGSADIKDIQLGKSNFQKTFYMSENPDYAKSFGGNKSSLNEIMVDSKAKLADLRKPSDDLVKQIEDIISSKPTGKTVRIQKPDGTFLEIPETKGGLSNPVHSSKDILNGIRQGKAYFAEMPEVKNALKKLGYDGMITQESKMGTNFGVWNKDILKTKSQLEEIWKKANKNVEIEPLIQEAKLAAEGNIMKEQSESQQVQPQEQEKISSRVFERLQKENPSILDGDLEATKVNLKKDAEKAVALVEKDKQLAYDIAIGKDVSSDVTSTAVNIALAEKALQEGNNSLYAKLIKARSLAQTRRGQEIVAEKGSVNDNSTSKYVKELINLKLEKLGVSYLNDIVQDTKNVFNRGRNKKQRGIDVVNDKVGEIEKKIKTKKLDTKTAIKLLEELKCI